VVDLEITHPIDMSTMAEYQSGAVVSRTIVNKPTGTVTIFAFDAGTSLSEHTAPFDAMLYVSEGEAIVRLGGAKHIVTAGQVLLLPADIPHALEANNPLKMMLIMVKA
jgi:quercetin dioxygenase-like cupin family protein